MGDGREAVRVTTTVQSVNEAGDGVRHLAVPVWLVIMTLSLTQAKGLRATAAKQASDTAVEPGTHDNLRNFATRVARATTLPTNSCRPHAQRRCAVAIHGSNTYATARANGYCIVTARSRSMTTISGIRP